MGPSSLIALEELANQQKFKTAKLSSVRSAWATNLKKKKKSQFIDVNHKEIWN